MALTTALMMAAATLSPLNAQSTDYQGDRVARVLAEAHQRWRRLLLTGQPDSIADAFTVDLVSQEAGVADVVGREGVHRRTFEVFGAGAMRMLDLVPVTTSALAVGDSVISEAGVYVERLQRSGEAPFNIIAHYFIIWQQGTDSFWRIQRVIQHVKPAP